MRALFYLGILSLLVFTLGGVVLYLYFPAEFDLLTRIVVATCVLSVVLGALESFRKELFEDIRNKMQR